MQIVTLSLAFLPLLDAFSLRSGSLKGDGDGNAAKTTEAIGRLESVEDQRTSRVLCRLSGTEGQGTTTVRLQPATNTRSLVFNDDVLGVETRVGCSEAVGQECLATKAPSLAQSVEECPACPCTNNNGKLYGKYATAMADEIDGRCDSRQSSDAPLRVLMLGLGAGELAAHVAKHCGAAAEVEAVELDGRLPALARRYFGLPDSVKVTVGDGGSVAASLLTTIKGDELLADQRRYDVVLVDCFSTGGVTPESCRSADFVKTVKPLLRDGGSVMHHLWHTDAAHPEVKGDFDATVKLYQEEFKCKGCGVALSHLDGPDDIVVSTIPKAADN